MRFLSKLCKPFEFKGTNKKAILLIHGFTDSPAKMLMIAEFLNKKGFTVKGILLKGHGTDIKNMDNATYQNWIHDAEKGYKELKKEYDYVSVIGFSMGAMLALYLGIKFDVNKIVAISPALVLKNKKTIFAPVFKYFMKYNLHQTFAEEHPKEALGYKLDHYIEYSKIPIKGLCNLIKLEKHVKKDLSKIICPIFIIQPLKDDVVDVNGAKIIYEKINSKNKKVLWLKKSRHTCQLGPERNLIHKEILKFLKI
jgi:carboxylesterase